MGSSEPTLVKMPHCCKSHVMAQILFMFSNFQVNAAGTMATAQTDGGPMLIFDIENREYLYSVSNKDYDEDFARSMLVNDKKTHVLFSTDIPGDSPIPGVTKAFDVIQVVVWDVEKSEFYCPLL